MKKEIKKKLETIPSSPGIYQFFNEQWEIIYIGKSIHLKKRVKSYFAGTSKLNFAKRLMVEQISDIQTLVTNNETESLILEHTLVRDKKPKFNVLLKDDKNYLYIKVTKEPFPKIIKTRIKGKTGTYYGPYTQWHYVANILRLAKKIFWYGCYGVHFFRQGKQYNLDKYIFKNHTDADGKSLTQADIESHYKERISEIESFLKWDTFWIISRLEQKMKSLAWELKFEQAAKIKYDIESLHSLNESQIVRDFVSGDFEVIHILEKYDTYYLWNIEIRESKISGFYHYEVDHHLEETPEEILKNYIEHRFAERISQNPWTKTPTFILPFAVSNLSKEIKTEVPKIWGKLDILKLAYKNTYEYAHKKHLASLSTKWFSKKTMSSLLSKLGYAPLGKNIIFECNDISHLSGTHTVASRSVIENGKKNPQKYRKFNIKNLEEGKIDDFDSMREIIQRRLKELVKLKNTPDLIVIDGWKWQLSAVMQVIEEYSNSLTESERHATEWLQIVGIAKREEELFVPANRLAGDIPQSLEKTSSEAFYRVLLDRDSDELRLIQSLRDEAHRFAITFNRDKRNTSMKKNLLQSIPGIGPITRKKILKTYGSIEWLKWQSQETLEKTLGKKITEILDDHGLI